MTTDVAVVTDITSMRMGRTSAITGVVALRVGEFWFPSQAWTDFVVVVLGWWARQCAALQAGNPAQFEVMDGSYTFVARPTLEGTAHIECLTDRPPRGALVKTFEVPTAAFHEAIMSACHSTLAACASKGWSTPDVETLRSWAR